MAIKSIPETITKDVLLHAAQNRLMQCAKMFWDPNTTAQQMYEDLTCSVFSGDPADDFPEIAGPGNIKPILDADLCFEYKGYRFELLSCNNITTKQDMLGVTEENFKQRFPHGVLSDRYVCWMYGHKDITGQTKEESDDPETWSPNIYLVNAAWSWGADPDLKPGLEVNEIILTAIDKFLETFKE